MQSCVHCLSSNLLCNSSRPCNNCLVEGICCVDGGDEPQEGQTYTFSNLFSPLPPQQQPQQQAVDLLLQQQQPLPQPSPPTQSIDLQFIYDLLNTTTTPPNCNIPSASLPPHHQHEGVPDSKPSLNNHTPNGQNSSPLLALFSASPQNIMERLQTLENYVSQYSVQISKLVQNLVSNSQRPTQDEKPAWHLLLSLTNVIVCVREKKTLCLMGHNKLYSDFFLQNNVPLSESGNMYRSLLDRIDPFYTLLVLNIVRQDSPFNLMRCKLIYYFEKPKLVEVITHVDDTFVWTELNVVESNVFDDGFVIGNNEHKPTVFIPLPPNGTFTEWKNIVQPHSAKRFQQMMIKFLS